MTNNQSPETPENRLNRIEAALDRQVAVNADLRTSVTELRQTAEALVQVATIYQQNFERLTTEINADRQEWKAQIDHIWQYLLQKLGDR